MGAGSFIVGVVVQALDIVATLLVVVLVLDTEVGLAVEAVNNFVCQFLARH
jgi:hypothetical protein